MKKEERRRNHALFHRAAIIMQIMQHNKRPTNASTFAGLLEHLRPNSITLSSSLAGRRPVREPAFELVRELDSVMEFGLYST